MQTTTKPKAELTFMVAIPWPTENIRGSTCPNEVFRPWLEEKIGKQQRAWDWKQCDHDVNQIEVRFKRSNDAMMFKLLYGEQ